MAPFEQIAYRNCSDGAAMAEKVRHRLNSGQLSLAR